MRAFVFSKGYFLRGKVNEAETTRRVERFLRPWITGAVASTFFSAGLWVVVRRPSAPRPEFVPHCDPGPE
jgi:hypothetical protein